LPTLSQLCGDVFTEVCLDQSRCIIGTDPYTAIEDPDHRACDERHLVTFPDGEVLHVEELFFALSFTYGSKYAYDQTEVT
jgi:hypothetical protein